MWVSCGIQWCELPGKSAGRSFFLRPVSFSCAAWPILLMFEMPRRSLLLKRHEIFSYVLSTSAFEISGELKSGNSPLTATGKTLRTKGRFDEKNSKST
jgi:hypothetical protein